MEAWYHTLSWPAAKAVCIATTSPTSPSFSAYAGHEMGHGAHHTQVRSSGSRVWGGGAHVFAPPRLNTGSNLFGCPSKLHARVEILPVQLLLRQQIAVRYHPSGNTPEKACAAMCHFDRQAKLLDAPTSDEYRCIVSGITRILFQLRGQARPKTNTYAPQPAPAGGNVQNRY